MSGCLAYTLALIKVTMMFCITQSYIGMNIHFWNILNSIFSIGTYINTSIQIIPTALLTLPFQSPKHLPMSMGYDQLLGIRILKMTCRDYLGWFNFVLYILLCSYPHLYQKLLQIAFQFQLESI